MSHPLIVRHAECTGAPVLHHHPLGRFSTRFDGHYLSLRPLFVRVAVASQLRCEVSQGNILSFSFLSFLFWFFVFSPPYYSLLPPGPPPATAPIRPEVGTLVGAEYLLPAQALRNAQAGRHLARRTGPHSLFCVLCSVLCALPSRDLLPRPS